MQLKLIFGLTNGGDNFHSLHSILALLTDNGAVPNHGLAAKSTAISISHNPDNDQRSEARVMKP